MHYKMNYNFHTHTSRCHHATGEDREYVESAIKAGIKVLGFSDHAPYPYPGGFISTIRMLPSELEDYITSIRSLKQEYATDISIFVGFEAEYQKPYWADFCKLVSPYDMDYLILGQHFLKDEITGSYSGAPTSREADLEEYVNEVIEAINTGVFTYIAHPDLICFTGDEDIYKKHMTRLCLAAKELSMPLEINLCGCLSRRHYPSNRFFSLAKALGNDFVFGRDAHTPDAFFDEKTMAECAALAECTKIKTLAELELCKPVF